MDGTGGIEDGEGDVMISESFGRKGIWTGTAGGERGIFLEEKNCFGGFEGDFHSGRKKNAGLLANNSSKKK